MIIILFIIVVAIIYVILSSIDIDNISLWIQGKTDNHLSPENKAGLIIRNDGSHDFQSTIK